MEVYNKQFPISTRDINWGFEIHYCGYSFVQPFETYPSEAHFNKSIHLWQVGRVLDTYCILYIREGEGFFQTEGSPVNTIKAGTLILLYPGEWHRYKPKEKTGWKEYWIAFDGTYPRSLIEGKIFFSKKKPIFHMNETNAIMRDFTLIISTTKVERFAIQQILSGIVLKMLGKVYSNTNQKFESSSVAEVIVKRCLEKMEGNLKEPFDFFAFKNDESISYSWFRNIFKQYTGFSPNQYHIQLRVQKAKDLLSFTNMPIKAVALDTGFSSSYYFSRLFKQKTGLTPSHYREHSWGKE